MARIDLKGASTNGRLRAKKSALVSNSKEYRVVTEEANKRIDENQRRYADAYQRASTFLARQS